MAKLKERAFDREKENRADGVDRQLDEEMRRQRCQRDVVTGTRLHCFRRGMQELDHGVDDEFVTEVNAVGNAGDKRCAWHFDATKR